MSAVSAVGYFLSPRGHDIPLAALVLDSVRPLVIVTPLPADQRTSGPQRLRAWVGLPRPTYRTATGRPGKADPRRTRAVQRFFEGFGTGERSAQGGDQLAGAARLGEEWS